MMTTIVSILLAMALLISIYFNLTFVAIFIKKCIERTNIKPWFFCSFSLSIWTTIMFVIALAAKC